MTVSCSWCHALNVFEVGRLCRSCGHRADAPRSRCDCPECRTLYDVARQVCHAHGIAWTDPRTSVTYPPPLRTAERELERDLLAEV